MPGLFLYEGSLVSDDILKIVLQTNKCSQCIYRCINISNDVPNSFLKWKTLPSLNEAQEITVCNIFKICFKVSKDSRVQWLQYRILHRILPVKYYLKKLE